MLLQELLIQEMLLIVIPLTGIFVIVTIIYRYNGVLSFSEIKLIESVSLSTLVCNLFVILILTLSKPDWFVLFIITIRLVFLLLTLDSKPQYLKTYTITILSIEALLFYIYILSLHNMQIYLLLHDISLYWYMLLQIVIMFSIIIIIIYNWYFNTSFFHWVKTCFYLFLSLVLVYLFVSYVVNTTYEITKVTNIRDLHKIIIIYLYSAYIFISMWYIISNKSGENNNSIYRLLFIFALICIAIYIFSLIIGIVLILFINTTSA